MVEAYELRASVVHDRLYAIRNLTVDGVDDMLAPDYTLPPAEVWRRTAIGSVQSRPDRHASSTHHHEFHHESVLLALAGVSRMEGVDLSWSWVPDMSELTARHWDTIRQYESVPFHAGGGKDRGLGRSSCFSHDSTSPDLLYASGALISTIQDLLRPFPCPPSRRYLQSQLFISERRSVPLQNLAPFLQHGVLGNAPSAWKLHSKPTDIAIEPQNSITNRPHHPPSPPQENDAQVLPYPPFNPTKALAHFTDGRFGWVPHTAEKDDIAVLLRDAPFPFIFRKNPNDTFTNLGDCYIEGVMYGEALPVDGEGGLDGGFWKWIAIR